MNWYYVFCRAVCAIICGFFAGMLAVLGVALLATHSIVWYICGLSNICVANMCACYADDLLRGVYYDKNRMYKLY